MSCFFFSKKSMMKGKIATYLSSQQPLFLAEFTYRSTYKTGRYGKFCMCLDLTLFIYAAINRGELKVKTKLQRKRYTRLRFFLASILKFVLFLCQLRQNIKMLLKKFVDQAIIGGGTIFPRSLRLSGIEFSLV